MRQGAATSAVLMTLALLTPKAQSADAGVQVKTAPSPLGARPVEVSADSLTVLNLEQRAEYRGHAKAVRDSTTITCDTLVVHYDENRKVSHIDASGNVEAVDGERAASGDEARYDNRTGLLTVTGSPKARSGQRRVSGEQISFVTGSERLEVTQAKTVAENEQGPSGPQRLEIDADKLVFESDQHLAVWSGHVKARRGTTRLLAPELTARYDDAGVVTKVVARGGVEVFDKDRWAKGERADFDNATGVLVVTGKPQARQGQSHMRGTKVTFLSGADQLEVENATTVIEVAPKTGKKGSK